MKIIGIQHEFVKTDSNYKRYALTENGISPRGIPGLGEGLIRVDSDEHDEFGHITEDLQGIREQMIDKRINKKGITIENLEPALPLEIFGGNGTDLLVICWGSSYLAVKEAIEEINDPTIAGLHFSQVYPLPKNTANLVSKAKKVVLIESNATGQFAKLLKLYANIEIPKENLYLKSNGEPISVEEVKKFVKNMIEKGGNH
jgi:2-oxoglutarate ferredoxin oxidoreductase subunit alpha